MRDEAIEGEACWPWQWKELPAHRGDEGGRVLHKEERLAGRKRKNRRKREQTKEDIY